MQCGMDVYGNNTGTNMTLKENITSFLWGPRSAGKVNGRVTMLQAKL